MKSIEAAETKVATTNWKVASIKMLAYKAEGRASETKQEFQQAKRHADVVMDDAKSFAKKLKQGNGLQ